MEERKSSGRKEGKTKRGKGEKTLREVGKRKRETNLGESIRELLLLENAGRMGKRWERTTGHDVEGRKSTNTQSAQANKEHDRNW